MPYVDEYVCLPPCTFVFIYTRERYVYSHNSQTIRNKQEKIVSISKRTCRQRGKQLVCRFVVSLASMMEEIE